MNLADLKNAAILFAVIAITVIVAIDIVTEIGADYAADSAADNASDDAIEGLGELADWLPTIGLVLAAGVILTVVVKSFV